MDMLYAAAASTWIEQRFLSRTLTAADATYAQRMSDPGSPTAYMFATGGTQWYVFHGLRVVGMLTLTFGLEVVTSSFQWRRLTESRPCPRGASREVGRPVRCSIRFVPDEMGLCVVSSEEEAA